MSNEPLRLFSAKRPSGVCLKVFTPTQPINKKDNSIFLFVVLHHEGLLKQVMNQKNISSIKSSLPDPQ